MNDDATYIFGDGQNGSVVIAVLLHASTPTIQTTIMARPKSTTAQGREHEEAMVDLLEFDSARRSRSSGASWNDNTDVVSSSLAIECESTSAGSYSLKLDFWREVLSKSTADRMPLLGIQFRNVDAKRNTNLVVMDANDFAELLEKAKELDARSSN